MDYYWRDDILDVTDDRPDDQEVIWSGDEQQDMFYRAAERIVEENGEDYYDYPEDAVYDEMADIIGLWAISMDSELYDLLLEWYDNDYDKMMSNVRHSFEYGGYLFFVTGCNYATMSKDLLGGGSNGEAEREFEEWIRNK